MLATSGQCMLATSRHGTLTTSHSLTLMRSHHSLALLLLSVVVLFLASCGGGAANTSSQGTEGAQGTAPSGDAGSSATASGANPATERGNSLVIATAQDPGSWDPIDTFFLSWGMVANQIFDGLVDRGLDLQLQPGLATSWDWLDDQTLQFKLRQGVKFHDGEPFNADAVVFTFDRLLGPEGAKGPQQANYASIEKVVKVDDYTVNFVMKTKDPVIITKLAGYGAMIVPPQYLTDKGDAYFDAHPVGTGPFKFVEYAKDDHLALEANTDYWNGAPKLDKVTYRFIPEPATRLAELQTGHVDVAQGIQSSQADAVSSVANLTLQTAASPTVVGLRFDVSKPPVDDARVRQAINYAVDKQGIIDSILQGYGKTISTFQGEKSFGNDPDLKPYPYDPDKAKQLLQEAGVKSGTPIKISIIGTDATFKEVAQAVASMLQAVGFTPSIETYESNTFWNDIVPNAKTGQMYYEGWGGWTLDFDNTAYILYHQGEFWNPSFSDSLVEQYLEEERSTYDQEKRLAAFKKLDARFHELAIEVPLYQQVNLWGVNKRVQDFQAPVDDRIRLLGTSVK